MTTNGPPVAYPVPVPWVEINAHNNTFCGLGNDGGVYCLWPLTSRRVAHLQALGHVRHVVPGDVSVCGIQEDGSVACCYLREDVDIWNCGAPYPCQVRGPVAGGSHGTLWSADGEIARLTTTGCADASVTVRGRRVDGLSEEQEAAGLLACEDRLAAEFTTAVCRRDRALVVGGRVIDVPCDDLRAGAGLCVRAGDTEPWRCIDIQDTQNFPASGRLPVPESSWNTLPLDVDDVAIDAQGCYRRGADITCWSFGEGGNFTPEVEVEQRVFWRGRIGGEVGSASLDP